MSLFIVYFRCGLKLRFWFKSWNVAFANAFLLRFITYPIGLDWYLLVFSTVFQSFKCFHGLLYVLYHVYYFHILMLLASVVLGGHLCVFLMCWLLLWFFKWWVIVRIREKEMFVFRKIWLALFSCNTRFEIRPFALLPSNSIWPCHCADSCFKVEDHGHIHTDRGCYDYW